MSQLAQFQATTVAASGLYIYINIFRLYLCWVLNIYLWMLINNNNQINHMICQSLN